MGGYSVPAAEFNLSDFDSVGKPISWKSHFVREFVGIEKPEKRM